MNKNAVKRTMLTLSREEMESARQHYNDYFAEARVDRSEATDDNRLAHARFAGELAEAFEHPLHTYEAKLEQLEAIDFSPKTEVGPGAIVKVAGRYLVVAVSTRSFQCEGRTLMGISPQAPIYAAMDGKRIGESCPFRGRELTVEEIF